MNIPVNIPVIEPTIGRVVHFRGKDGKTRAAIVTYVHSTFVVNLTVFGRDYGDDETGIHTSVTHGQIENEPGCFPSWGWMPFQLGQAAQQTNA